MIRARIVAVLVAVVLGAGGGAITAVVVGDDDVKETAYPDPLGIDYPMVNLPTCTGDPVLVIGNGDSAQSIIAAISSLPEDERPRARYLRTADSCTARWVAEDSTAEPEWVAYLGPGTRADLCLDRMSAAHQGDSVTFLIKDNPYRATCLCEVPVQEVAPVLSPDMEVDSGTVIWVKSLQNMFVTIDEPRTNPVASALTEDDVTGVYDERTIARVRDFAEASDKRVDGVVDGDIWERLKRTGCHYVADYS